MGCKEQHLRRGQPTSRPVPMAPYHILVGDRPQRRITLRVLPICPPTTTLNTYNSEFGREEGKATVRELQGQSATECRCLNQAEAFSNWSAGPRGYSGSKSVQPAPSFAR